MWLTAVIAVLIGHTVTWHHLIYLFPLVLTVPYEPDDQVTGLTQIIGESEFGIFWKLVSLKLLSRKVEKLDTMFHPGRGSKMTRTKKIWWDSGFIKFSNFQIWAQNPKVLSQKINKAVSLELSLRSTHIFPDPGRVQIGKNQTQSL